VDRIEGVRIGAIIREVVVRKIWDFRMMGEGEAIGSMTQLCDYTNTKDDDSRSKKKAPSASLINS